MVEDEEQFAKAKPFVALDFTTLVDKWICLLLSISIAIMLVQTTSNSLLEFCNRLMFGLPPSIHSSDSCQLWLFKNINESSLLRFIKLLQKFPMALVVQSKSSPRICQHFHHFVHSSHTYHFPYTFPLYGPILLLPQGLSICCYSYLGRFFPKYSHSSSPPTLQVFIIPLERAVWLYFLTYVALGKPFTFLSLSVLIKAKMVEFLSRKMEILINDSEKTS